MSVKRRTKKRTSNNKPVFTDAEYKLIQNYGIGDLLTRLASIASCSFAQWIR
jgi:hypothetical protein